MILSIVVILETKIYVHKFSDLSIIDVIETFKNTKGLSSLNLDGDHTILACCDSFSGFVNIKFYDEKK